MHTTCFLRGIKMSWLRKEENSMNIKMPLLILLHVCRHIHLNIRFWKSTTCNSESRRLRKCKPFTFHLRWTQIKCRWVDREQCRAPWLPKIHPILHSQLQNSLWQARTSTVLATLREERSLHPWCTKGLIQSSLKSTDTHPLTPVLSGSGSQIHVPVLSQV